MYLGAELWFLGIVYIYSLVESTHVDLHLVLEPRKVVVKVGTLHWLLAPTRYLGNDTRRLWE